MIRAATAEFDLVTLGEVMLRLDPGPVPVHAAPRFDAWAGGGEFNVSAGLAACFGRRASHVTTLVDNAIGRAIARRMRAAGVDDSHVLWCPHDGTDSAVRNGLYFLGRGATSLTAVSDRGHSAASTMTPDDIAWDDLFIAHPSRWFHTGGIFIALSSSTGDVATQAMAAARSHRAVVSFDLNYRASLWGTGGLPEANRRNWSFVRQSDVVFGDPVKFATSMGWGAAQTLGFEHASELLAERSGSVSSVVCARSEPAGHRTARRAVAWSSRTGTVVSRPYDIVVHDRVGAGDALAAGFIAARLDGRSMADAVEIAAAHSALVMTTPGDVSLSSASDVDQLVARVNEGVGPSSIDR